jgi:hypothetical protein
MKRERLLNCSGSEIAELAIVMPLLFTLILGIYSFGRAYNIYSTVTRAAQDGARVAVAPACVSCTLSCTTGIGNQFPCNATVAQVVLDTLRASNLDPNQVSQLALPNSTQGGCPPPASASPSCTPAQLPGTSQSISICRDVLLNNTGTAPACGTTVSFQYNYQFVPVPFIRMNSFRIPARAQMKTEY